MLRKLLQDQNAWIPIVTSVLGSVMLVRLPQRKKAQVPILVMLLPIVTLVRVALYLNPNSEVER